MNTQPLANRTAIVTGSARGIGYGIAHRLAVEGAKVVVSDINDEAAHEAAQKIMAETGQRTLAIHCDVADRASVDELIARTVSELGSLDIAVANAGVCPIVEFLDMDNDTWQKTIDVILTGSFNTAQAAARAMVDQGKGGRIIFITSTATISTNWSQVGYASAKSGVRLLMAGMAVGLGQYNITVNGIAPGAIYTRMSSFHWDVRENREAFEQINPMRRLGQPEDIAGAAVFLASDDAAYITGTTIRVDGGAMPNG